MTEHHHRSAGSEQPRGMEPILNSLMQATLDVTTTSRPALRKRFEEILRGQVRDPAQAPSHYTRLLDAAKKCVESYPVASGRHIHEGRDGYGWLRELRLVVDEIAAQPPAAPVEMECDTVKHMWDQVEKARADGTFSSPVSPSSAGSDQGDRDLVANSWGVLESYGFAPEACDYLPQAIDNALAAVIGARDDLLAEVTRLRAAPQSPLEWLAGHTNYELSFSGWDEDPAWLVHSVNGGRNDREWTLLSTGSTPEEALRKAMARTVTRPHEKSRGAEFPSHGRNTP
jgi:hypothetical protein